MPKAQRRLIALSAFFPAFVAGFLSGTSCQASPIKNTGCQTDADCGKNEVCNNKVCQGQILRGSSTGGGAASATGGNNGTSSGTSGGGGNGTSNGGNGTSSTGGTSGGVCAGACSTACCSQNANNGLTCLNGKKCGGDGGVYFCNDQDGICDPFDPCYGSSGNWTCNGVPTTGGGGGTTGGGPACYCTTACCSQIAGSGITCPGGKYCYGTSDAGPFYCNDQNGKCDPFDPCDGSSGDWLCDGGSSAGGTSGTGGSTTGGSSGTPTIMPGGLIFAVIGDTRPADDCSSISDCQAGGADAYPTQIITQIYQDLAQLSPRPMYVLGTGDYQENSPGTGTSSWQLDQYLGAIADGGFLSDTFLAMGNHECNGVPSSECGPNGADGITENYTGFMNLLSTLGISNTVNGNRVTYYTEGPFTIAATGQTVKFIMLSANSWDSDEQAWFDTQLSVATTFTFVSRHEPDDATGLSTWEGITGPTAVMANHPGAITMRMEGHTHELRWSWGTAGPDGGAGEAIVGNGGAQPWDCSGTTSTIYCDFGFLLCQERTDNSIQCTPYSESSNTPAPSPAPFAANPNGAENRN